MKRGYRAFTLVEILITVSIFFLVFAGILRTLIRGFADFDSRSERIDILSQCNILTAYLRRDLRTAVWSDEAPIVIGPGSITFHRVAGIKVGSDGNIGMPELRVVRYEWDGPRLGIIRRVAAVEHVREKVFLQGFLEAGGLSVAPMDGTTGSTITYIPSGALVLNLCMRCRNNIEYRRQITVFSRFMGASERDAFATAWLHNWFLHPTRSAAFKSLTDEHSVLQFSEGSDRDKCKDVGLAMGGSF